MRPPAAALALAACLACLACTRSAAAPAGESPATDSPATDSPAADGPAAGAASADAGLDSLNARIAQAYRARDPQAYAALFTDTAVFEWPAFTTVRGRAGLAAMARDNWASLRDQDLRLTVAARRLAPGHATEFGAFAQSYRDSAGTRRTEYGRYASVLVRQPDGSWRMDRFFGFADSTRPPLPAP